MIRLYDVVRLRRAYPAERLPAGTTGTVVHLVERPSPACVVEIADGQGRTRALLTLAPDEIELAGETAPGLAASG